MKSTTLAFYLIMTVGAALHLHAEAPSEIHNQNTSKVENLLLQIEKDTQLLKEEITKLTGKEELAGSVKSVVRLASFLATSIFEVEKSKVTSQQDQKYQQLKSAAIDAYRNCKEAFNSNPRVFDVARTLFLQKKLASKDGMQEDAKSMSRNDLVFSIMEDKVIASLMGPAFQSSRTQELIQEIKSKYLLQDIHFVLESERGGFIKNSGKSWYSPESIVREMKRSAKG